MTVNIAASTYTLEAGQDPNNLANAQIVLNVDYSATGACAITLPAISTFGNSPNVQILLNDSGLLSATNNITVSCNASDKINNAASMVLAVNGGCATLQIAGANDWIAVSPQGGLVQVAATATADGLTTGTIANGNCFVAVTSANANNIVVLPAPVPGTIVRLRNGATGYELRTSSPTTVGINGGVGAAAESAIAANTYVEMQCDSATSWIGRQYTTAGVQSAVEVAAP